MTATWQPFEFGTKGETLERLAPLVHGGRLCEQLLVPVPRWLSEPDVVLGEIIDSFADVPLAVRSSSAKEDGWNGSMAGHYLSLTGVSPRRPALTDAIGAVLDRYGRAHGDDQILIQPMVRDVAISGVATTRDLDTGGPYYVVNYDDFSKRTDTVTSGAVGKTVFFYRSQPEAIHSSRFRKLLEALQEIEQITGSDALDIEFCIDAGDEIFILQVRPIAARSRWQSVPDGAVDRTLAELRRDVAERMQPRADVAGRTTILGEMPDWNPAEMIGNMPRPLALSLYERLITDETWWRARAEMGYRPTPAPLMFDLCGRPYIDVRLSLNSFLPAGLDERIAGRVVDAELDLLTARRELHDKIEFEVAITCRDFAFDREADRLREAGLAASEIAELEAGLRRVTAAALEGGSARLDSLLALTSRRPPSELAQGHDDGLDAARRHFAHCLTHGTLPFSVLARHAFIGVAFLRSLTELGILDAEQSDGFFRSIRTVAGRLVDDMHAVRTSDLSLEGFLERHGHLRPGTYDIQSWRYDERPELFLGPAHRFVGGDTQGAIALTDRQRAEIDGLLRGLDYGLDAEAFLDYVAAAITAREEAKFAFSHDLSDGLSALVRWGERNDLTRDDLSYLTIEEIFGAEEVSDRLRGRIDEERERNRIARALRLPHLITEPDDLDVVRLPEGRPNFITSRSVTAPARRLAVEAPAEIDGVIVLTEYADPGFDWIFSRNIAGLVTKYGGTNSHMAIRCAEFGVPAAIGCGERLFERLLDALVIELNCAAHRIDRVEG